MIKILANLFLISIATPAFADEVWVRTEEVTAAEFQAKVILSPHTISWSEWWIRNRLSEQDVQKHEKRLVLAQSEFLKGGIERSIALFNEIIEFENSADWKLEQRRTFAYAHLRLAQMAGDQEKRTQEIVAASKWGAVPIRQELFPIAIIAEYQLALRGRIKDRLDLDLRFPGARYILIDGLPIEVKAAAEVFIDSLKHRFTLVFDHRPEVTLVATWGELKKWSPPPQHYVSGTCDSPIWDQKPTSTENIRFVFKNNCLLQWRQSDETKNVVQTLDLPTRPLPSAQPSMRNTDWLWYTGGLLLLGAVVALQQDRGTPSSPTTTIGF